MAGLSASAIRLLQEIHRALPARDRNRAHQALQALTALAPSHPETLRARAAIAHLQGRDDESIALLRRVVESRPQDATVLFDLGSALAMTGDNGQAIAAFRKSADLEPVWIAPLLGMARVFERTGDIDRSIAMLHEALRREPRNVAVRNVLARELHFAGRIDESRDEYRRSIQLAPTSAMAWFGLSTLRTSRFDANDLASIRTLLGRSDLRETDRIAASFALAKACEDNERYDDAFRAMTDANAARRRQLQWDAAKFSANEREIEQAFASSHAESTDATMGRGIVFIVGMPRSGSTLVEQMLAAHPDAASGGELDDVRDIILAESQRREVDFPAWVATTAPDDWRRLGQGYLDRTAKLRGQGGACFVDKALLNWRYIGAIRAMLPAARFVDCRRDAVETCLGCYRQMFSSDLPFTYDLHELAKFHRDYDRAMRFWRERYPDDVLVVEHERLVAQPEAEARRLLGFCGMAFDEAVLHFHENRRSIRTASAAQVREPLRSDTARAHFYGALLDPLRALLARDDAPT
ncbi:MAG TPA: sulfotransferase [Rhodanobacteraceae bacterium]|nr:sulfotransferase [Rhodanobacteraceae bacterium]